MPKRKAQYFVYCKSVCKDITPGKLRVCCSRCNEGAMVLYQVIIYFDDIASYSSLKSILDHFILILVLIGYSCSFVNLLTVSFLRSWSKAIRTLR